MASSPAVQHREKTSKAYVVMEALGLKRTSVTLALKQLLKAYNNQWDFIEAENYRLLADHIFEQQEAQSSKSPPKGPVTRGRRPNPEEESAEFSDVSFLTPPKGRADGRPAVQTPSSSRAAANQVNPMPVPVKTHVENLPSARATSTSLQQQRRAEDQLRETVARGVEYHSGASVRGRAEVPNDHDRGKSPMVQTQRASSSPPRLVSVKIEVCSGVTAPQGFESLAFEKVDGMIVPAVRRPQTEGVMAAKQSKLVVANPACVKVEPVDPEILCSRPPPAALHESEGTLTRTCVKNKLEETDARPHINGIKCTQKEILLLEAAGSTSPRPQYLPQSKSEQGADLLRIAAGPNVAQRSEVVDRSDLLPLVDYESEEEPVELDPQAVASEGCEMYISPEDAVQNVLSVDVPLNSEEIRPKFILENKNCRNGCEESRPPKRELTEECAGHSKRRKCETERPIALPLDNGHTDPEKDVNTPLSNATSKRKQVISDSPSPRPDSLPSGNVYQQAVPSMGVRRRLIVAESPTSEERPAVGLPASVLKRVKIEPGLENPNSPQKKQPPRDPTESPTERERRCHDSADIARGTETFPIPFVNGYTSETVPWNFKYIRNNVVTENAYINFSLARIGDEDCCSRCTDDCLKAPHPCACTRETGGDYAYTIDGILKPSYLQSEMDRIYNADVKLKYLCYCPSGWDCPIERTKNDTSPDDCKGHMLRRFLKECWHKCGCSMQCGNRVVQRGISRKLEVFFTKEGKGWGLCSKEDLPAGAFVCEYVGEIITNMELDNRNEETKEARRKEGLSGRHKDTYPVLLDGDWVSEKGLKDEEALCLDATNYGNVARFINHRCFDANLIDIPVTFDSQDRHYYHIAFFTNRDVGAGEELTWDYKIDFEDDDHPIEAFKCLCKSKHCRGVNKKQK